MYIYAITNVINGKIYIGKYQRKNLSAYFRQTIVAAERGGNHKPRLFNAIRKYGSVAFIITIIVHGTDKQQLAELEKFFIKTTEAQNPEIGYNITAGGDGFTGKHSDETKKNIAGLKKSNKHHLGFKHSEESRKLMSQNRKGKHLGPLTEEHRRKLSIVKMGKKSGPRGPMPQWIRDKISITKLGKPKGKENPQSSINKSIAQKALWERKRRAAKQSLSFNQ
jgi:group I intron endonuclease